MTVSVCIPSYNSAKYLRECIESVLSQTYTDFELIVSDDGSSDETFEIARSFSDSRIRIDRAESHLGLVGNFNRALDLARGKYVKLLCYDDKLEPACLERQVGLLEENPNMVLVTSGMRLIDATGRTVGNVSHCRRQATLRDVDVIAGNLAFGNLIGVPSSVLMRREVQLQAGPFSPEYPQMTDVELYLRILERGTLGYIPECLCAWRVHAGSATTQHRRAGIVRKDLRQLTAAMLDSVTPTWAARRTAWGRVAGSFLAQAVEGLRHGSISWPLTAVAGAFRIDPFFFGLAAFLALFKTGVASLSPGPGRRVQVRWGRTFGEFV